MKNKILIASSLILLFPGAISIAQENSSDLSLSLKEAQDYAVQHNKMTNSARMDLEASKMAVWETISSGLPQISTSASFTDNIKQMVFLLPDFIGGTDKKTPITMGSKFNSSLGFQAAMPIFNASYYVGIETVKLANKLAETNVKSTELDVRESIASAYYLILISEASLNILDGNLANLQETLKSTRAMYSVGMAESTDVDQMVSNVTMVQNSCSSLERTVELNYNLLRFQLGVPTDTRIVLKESIDDLTKQLNVEALLSQEFNYSDNLNYKLIEGQEKMSALNLKSQKALVLPTLTGVITGSRTGMGDKIPEIEWYNSSLYMFQLSFPIFASGQRYSKIRKAQINLEKARNTRDIVTDQLRMQEKQLRYNLVNANIQYTSQKDNVEVSKRVFTSVENKYRQGMASSLDLTQANSLYLTAENNYVSSLMNLLQTKLALDKLLNNM
ncbi:MAG: TolC family protein [Bacteroidales bacterium]|nr:TolC family protein [Bacteroidales bacterium]